MDVDFVCGNVDMYVLCGTLNVDACEYGMKLEVSLQGFS